MRFLIIVMTLMTTTAFSACPDLSGVTAKCQSTTGVVPGNTNQRVLQEIRDGVTIYTFISEAANGEEETQIYIADGKSRRTIEVDPDTGISLLTASTYSCKNNILYGHTTAFLDGQFLGIIDTETTKKEGTLTTIYESTLFGREKSDVIVCK